MKESIMSVAALVGSFDDIVRSTSVLAEGIEGGLRYVLLFVVLSNDCICLQKKNSLNLHVCCSKS